MERKKTDKSREKVTKSEKESGKFWSFFWAPGACEDSQWEPYPTDNPTRPGPSEYDDDYDDEYDGDDDELNF